MTSSETIAAPEAPEDAPPVVRDELGLRLDGLEAALRGAKGRIEESVLQDAVDLTSRANQRLTLSGEHTIVALAGATGSGKSSLFNALTDMELAGVGVRRPTTSWALACAWGPDGAGELLEWMGIPARHQVSRMGMLERADSDTSLEGLILLDLPDHDSTEVSHHLEMDRLVTHSDLLVWVLDPQKYADAAIHERYIRRMASFGAVTLVVLNQIDRIPYEQRADAIADVKRLIEEDGLPDVKVLGVSATRGDGLDELRRELANRIRQKSAAKARLLADVGEAAHKIAEVGGAEPPPTLGDHDRARLTDAIAESAGVPQVVDSIAHSTRVNAVRRSRWPVFGVFGRAKRSATGSAELGHVQQASTDLAIRDYVDQVALGMNYPWRSSVRKAAQSHGGQVASALDHAIKDSGVRLDRIPAWARLAQVLQWLLLVAAVVGLGWWLVLGVERWFDLDSGLPDLGSSAGLPAVAWIGLGAVAVGLLVDAIGRFVARSGANRRAGQAEQTLRAVIDDVTDAQVVAPVDAELTEYAAYRAGLLAATT